MANKDYVKVKFSKDRLDLLCMYMGYSHAELARAAGIGESTLSKACKKGSATDVTVKKICEVFLVPEEFLTGDRSMNKLATAYKLVYTTRQMVANKIYIERAAEAAKEAQEAKAE